MGIVQEFRNFLLLPIWGPLRWQSGYCRNLHSRIFFKLNLARAFLNNKSSSSLPSSIEWNKIQIKEFSVIGFELDFHANTKYFIGLHREVRRKAFFSLNSTADLKLLMLTGISCEICNFYSCVYVNGNLFSFNSIPSYVHVCFPPIHLIVLYKSSSLSLNFAVSWYFSLFLIYTLCVCVCVAHMMNKEMCVLHQVYKLKS